MVDPELRAQAAELDRDLWAARASEAITANVDLRRRITELERTVRILRVQLPLVPHALPAAPGGPDPRWAARIPSPRQPSDPVSRSPAPVPGPLS